MSAGWHWLPNILTIGRLILILPFAVAMINGAYLLALILFVIAGLSDGLDGFLARRFNWFSRFGAIADPLADKALLTTAFVLFGWAGVLPWWLVLLLLGRDCLIIAGALAYHYLIGPYAMEPALSGKLNTLVQILVVFGLLLLLVGWPLPKESLTFAIVALAVCSLLSGLHYVIVWGRRAWYAHHAGSSS